MSRVKVTRRHSANQSATRKEWPAIVYMSAFGLAITFYAIARVILDGKPHPYHWLAALVGGLVGIVLGWLWFRWRGDVF